MNDATTKIQDLHALVDLALSLGSVTPKHDLSPELSAALYNAQDHVARALAEASAALSTPPAPALENVAVKDLKIGDRVLLVATVSAVDGNDRGYPVAVHGAAIGTEWLHGGAIGGVLRDPREVRS